jgi:hypothetical protein
MRNRLGDESQPVRLGRSAILDDERTEFEGMGVGSGLGDERQVRLGDERKKETDRRADISVTSH